MTPFVEEKIILSLKMTLYLYLKSVQKCIIQIGDEIISGFNTNREAQ